MDGFLSLPDKQKVCGCNHGLWMHEIEWYSGKDNKNDIEDRTSYIHMKKLNKY